MNDELNEQSLENVKRITHVLMQEFKECFIDRMKIAANSLQSTELANAYMSFLLNGIFYILHQSSSKEELDSYFVKVQEAIEEGRLQIHQLKSKEASEQPTDSNEV